MRPNHENRIDFYESLYSFHVLQRPHYIYVPMFVSAYRSIQIIQVESTTMIFLVHIIEYGERVCYKIIVYFSYLLLLRKYQSCLDFSLIVQIYLELILHEDMQISQNLTIFFLNKYILKHIVHIKKKIPGSESLMLKINLFLYIYFI